MTSTGAAELMRNLGLLLDGPARWGAGIASRAAGIFVVELPGGAETAPLDATALRRWLERVPTLTIDGVQPTVAELSRKLAEFWLPGQPVLYVGVSAKSIGARVAAMNATPLGDARPSSAGHWLKALAAQTTMRVWWAETDAQEEYADALLEAIGAQPFANHDALDGSLRSEMATAAAAAGGRAGVRKVARRSGPKRDPSPRAKFARGRGASASGQRTGAPAPMLSHEGKERLSAELDELRTITRPDVIARVKAARELGDLRENADYEYARKEQSFVEGRIQTLENTLRSGVVIDQPTQTDYVHVGSTVEVESDGERFVFVIVGTAEANPAAGRLSNASPVGQALLGKREGDEVIVQSPGGSVTYRVVAVS